jgi:HK97 gp10 family phage protein
MARETVTIKNLPEFRRVMMALKAAPSGNALVSIAKAGILPIQNAAIENAPYRSGTLRRSIHTEVLRSGATSAFVATGTDVPYARRLEFGFQDTDALGRRYNQAARPYMRPAYDTRRGEAIAEVEAGLRELIATVR